MQLYKNVVFAGRYASYFNPGPIVVETVNVDIANMVTEMREMKFGCPEFRFYSGIDMKEVAESMARRQFVNSKYAEMIRCYLSQMMKFRVQIRSAIGGFVPLRENDNTNVYGVKMADVDNLCIMKSAVSKTMLKSLVSEAFVGVRYLNQLRGYIPNFMYTYGMHSCSTPLKDGTGRYSFCGDDGRTENTMVMYAEFITNGYPLREYDGDEESLILILIQIFGALQAAWDLCKFTHNDLHDENILIIKYDKPVVVNNHLHKYGYLGPVIYTQYIPVIIDYGFATYEHNGQLTGATHSQLGIGYNYGPIRDYHKLVLFLTRSRIPTTRRLANVMYYKLTGHKYTDQLRNEMYPYYSLPPFVLPNRLWEERISKVQYHEMIRDMFDGPNILALTYKNRTADADFPAFCRNTIEETEECVRNSAQIVEYGMPFEPSPSPTQFIDQLIFKVHHPQAHQYDGTIEAGFREINREIPHFFDELNRIEPTFSIVPDDDNMLMLEKHDAFVRLNNSLSELVRKILNTVDAYHMGRIRDRKSVV